MVACATATLLFTAVPPRSFAGSPRTLPAATDAAEGPPSYKVLRATGQPPIATAKSTSNAWISKATGTINTYTLTATAEPTGDTYTITRNANGTVARTCTVKSTSSRGGCPRATTTKVSLAYTW
jgi:hypothetical protein